MSSAFQPRYLYAELKHDSSQIIKVRNNTKSYDQNNLNCNQNFHINKTMAQFLAKTEQSQVGSSSSKGPRMRENFRVRDLEFSFFNIKN